LQNLFPPKGSLVNAPQKKKKGGKEKQKKRGGEKAKGKRRKGSETFSKKNHLEILLSARTLKTVIWHQEQKLVQCSTCKQRFGQFGFFSARQRPKNGLTRFQRHFLAKCPGVNWLMRESQGESSGIRYFNFYETA